LLSGAHIELPLGKKGKDSKDNYHLLDVPLWLIQVLKGWAQCSTEKNRAS
jgi:hypothetical protein